MLTIDGKTLGRKKPLFTDWSIPLPPDLGDDGGLTLRQLITRVVQEEVRAFRDRHEERKILTALTAAQIDQGVAKGKVDMRGRDLQQEIDDDQAIGAALQAFEDGIYMVVLDGEEQRELDKKIYLQPDSHITFIRLAMLAGG